MLATPPYGGRAVTLALWRAISKPPVELVVADFEIIRPDPPVRAIFEAPLAGARIERQICMIWLI